MFVNSPRVLCRGPGGTSSFSCRWEENLQRLHGREIDSDPPLGRQFICANHWSVTQSSQAFLKGHSFLSANRKSGIYCRLGDQCVLDGRKSYTSIIMVLLPLLALIKSSAAIDVIKIIYCAANGNNNWKTEMIIV